LLTLVVSMPGLVLAGDHVVAREAADAAHAAAASRAADLTTLRHFRYAEAEAARLAGTDSGNLQASSPSATAGP
jgi:hypothetical protein